MKTNQNDTTNRSQVTPKTNLKKTKEKLLFSGIVAIVLAMFIALVWPDKETLRAENDKGQDTTTEATLTQNLALITKMKEEALRLQTAMNSEPSKPQFVPSVVRGEDNKTKGLSQEMRARMNASSTFTLESSTLTPSESEGSSKAHATLAGNSANAEFINQQDDIVSVSAKRIPHPNFTIPAGELIPATLEVAINSELPGMVRAITERDIYSLTGGNRLIPSGSTLVGQFNSGVVQGQSRLLVVWNRVQMPDGVIVTLNSPGTDGLGRAGQGADHINRHFLERFGSGALLSILGGFTATAGVGSQDEFNSKAAYRMGIAQSLQQAASQSLEENMVIKPTLFINQGARVNVFVAYDLDFNQVGRAHVTQNPALLSLRGAPWK